MSRFSPRSESHGQARRLDSDPEPQAPTPFAQPMDHDLAARLRRIGSADPYLTAAIMLLLDGRQWEALRSQRIFQVMGDRLARMAGTAMLGRHRSAGTPQDLAQHVLGRLGEVQWLRTFVASRGTPGGYLNGVFAFQLRDAVRSGYRLKNRSLPSLATETTDPQSERGGPAAADRWSIADLREQVLRLSPRDRSAVVRRHPELGLDEHLRPAVRGERAIYKRTLAALREAMRPSGDRD